MNAWRPRRFAILFGPLDFSMVLTQFRFAQLSLPPAVVSQVSAKVRREPGAPSGHRPCARARNSGGGSFGLPFNQTPASETKIVETGRRSSIPYHPSW